MSNKFLGSTSGLTLVYGSGQCYVASDYTSGIMPASIKGAWLASTDSTDLVGGELVTNGTFDTDTSGWTAQLGAIITHTGSAIQVQSVGANSLATQYITADLSKNYIGTVTLVSSTGGTVLAQIGGVTTVLSVGENTFKVPAGRSNNKLDLTPGIWQTATFDNVTCRLADPDRSVAGNGLQVFGTITRTAVA